jgi:hypothetical protein
MPLISMIEMEKKLLDNNIPNWQGIIIIVNTKIICKNNKEVKIVNYRTCS